MADIQQSLRQASIRAVTGTTYDHQGDWHALWDSLGTAGTTFNERMLNYINTKLSASYTEINGAMAALAANLTVDSFQAIGTFTPGSAGGTVGLDFSQASNSQYLMVLGHFL